MRTTSRYSKQSIQDILLSSPKALMRGVVAIYKRQTLSEQADGITKEHNGIGFTGVDAFILSSFATQILCGMKLSERQLTIARRKMPKYWRQLIEIAETNDRIKASIALASKEGKVAA